MPKKFSYAKDVLDVNVNDFTIDDEIIIDDYDDTVLVLTLDCEYKKFGHSIDNLPNTYSMSQYVEKKIKFSIWKNTLYKLYDQYIENGVLGFSNIIESDHNMWNGISDLPMAHIDNFKVKDNIFTLFRYMTNTFDFSEYGDIKNDPNAIKLELNVTNTTQQHSGGIIVTDITLDSGLKLKKESINLNNTDFPVVNTSISDISFVETNSFIKDKFEEIKNDKEFIKMRVTEDNSNKIDILMKDDFSNDTDIKVKGRFTKIYKKDVVSYIDASTEMSGNLEIDRLNKIEDSYRLMVIPNKEYPGKLLESGNFRITDISRKENKDTPVSLENDIIKSIYNRKGVIYIYFNKTDFLTTIRDLDIYLEMKYRKFTERVYTLHKDNTYITKQIKYSTPYSYDSTTKFYTYNIDISDENIDNINDPEFVLTPDIKKDNIISVSIKDGLLTIVSDTILCRKNLIPSCNITCYGIYSYYTYEDKFQNENTKLSLASKYTSLDIKEDEEGCYVEYKIDEEENQDKYLDEEELTVVHYPVYRTMNYDTNPYNLVVNGYFIENNENIYFDISSESFKKYRELYSHSTIDIKYMIYYKQKIIERDKEFKDDVDITIKFNHNNKYECDRNVVFYNGSFYYVYTFYSHYNYMSKFIEYPEVNISYNNESIKDIVYDILYDHGVCNIYLVNEKKYRYTDISVSFYIGEYYQVIQEIYETYKFSNKAFEKLYKLLVLLNRERQPLMNFSTEKVISEINKI